MEFSVGNHPAKSLELFVRENGGAAQRSDESFAVDEEFLVVGGRNHAVVVRELAVDQFREKRDIPEGEPGLLSTDFNLHRIIVVGQHLHKLHHGLAGQNCFDLHGAFGFKG